MFISKTGSAALRCFLVDKNSMGSLYLPNYSASGRNEQDLDVENQGP